MRENIAASPGPGWRSTGTSLGTGAVVKPDPVEAAKSWAGSLGRPPGAKDRPAWAEQCRRLGIDDEGEIAGWDSITLSKAESWDRAVAELAQIFDEAVGAKWVGYWVALQPKKREVRPEDPEQPEDANPNVRKVQEMDIQRGGAFIGYPKMHRASSASGQDLQAQPSATFSFHTKSAELIWQRAQQLVRVHPEAEPKEIIRLAVQELGVAGMDLTPEDLVLLQMAIEWAQNGPAGTPPRTGGTPGGPLRTTSSGYGP